jgi:hypothetical protein
MHFMRKKATKNISTLKSPEIMCNHKQLSDNFCFIKSIVTLPPYTWEMQIQSGSLEHETVKYGQGSSGTRTRE